MAEVVGEEAETVAVRQWHIHRGTGTRIETQTGGDNELRAPLNRYVPYEYIVVNAIVEAFRLQLLEGLILPPSEIVPLIRPFDRSSAKIIEW